MYGGRDLRRAIRALGMGYVLAVRSSHALTPGVRPGPDRGRSGQGDPPRRLAADAHRARHQGQPPLRLDDARGDQRHTPDDYHGRRQAGRSALLVRRHRYTGTCSSCRCWTPEPVPLARLIAIAVTRWRIEEDHQLAKQAASLDSGQVIRWRSWHRWTAICLLACIYLAVAAAVHRDSHAGREIGLIPIYHSRAGAAATRHGHPTALPRPGPPSALVTLATPPPVPRPPGSSALEHLRRHHTMITTIYSCRIRCVARFTARVAGKPAPRPWIVTAPG